jgi:hypothetical protein
MDPQVTEAYKTKALDFSLNMFQSVAGPIAAYFLGAIERELEKKKEELQEIGPVSNDDSLAPPDLDKIGKCIWKIRANSSNEAFVEALEQWIDDVADQNKAKSLIDFHEKLVLNANYLIRRRCQEVVGGITEDVFPGLKPVPEPEVPIDPDPVAEAPAKEIELEPIVVGVRGIESKEVVMGNPDRSVPEGTNDDS